MMLLLTLTALLCSASQHEHIEHDDVWERLHDDAWEEWSFDGDAPLLNPAPAVPDLPQAGVARTQGPDAPFDGSHTAAPPRVAVGDANRADASENVVSSVLALRDRRANRESVVSAIQVALRDATSAARVVAFIAAIYDAAAADTSNDEAIARALHNAEVRAWFESLTIVQIQVALQALEDLQKVAVIPPTVETVSLVGETPVFAPEPAQPAQGVDKPVEKPVENAPPQKKQKWTTGKTCLVVGLSIP